MKSRNRDHVILRATAVAATLSGALSTVHAFATGRDPLEATKAAGTILLPNETHDATLVVMGTATHAAISLAWTTLLVKTLPRKHAVAWGAAAGAAIALVDLGWAARHRPRVAALPRLPQLADHVAFGVLVGWRIGRRD